MGKQIFEFVSSCEPYSVSLLSGQYVFELWGASGGDTLFAEGGLGVYVSAVLNLRSQKTFYVYIGGKGDEGNYSAKTPQNSCNGGGAGGLPFITAKYVSGASGGGATDVRLNSSLSSRIIVAAGGGGAGHIFKGGDAGTLKSPDAKGYNTTYSQGANQTNGYSFGIGQNGRKSSGEYLYGAEGNGGGGGGYYGGFSPQNNGQGSNTPGAGGSSFISGYFSQNSDPDFFLTSPVMVGGRNIMKTASTSISYGLGHIGNGFAIITRVENLHSRCIMQSIISFSFTLSIVLLK
jgi:hypothetical protein